MCLESKTCTDVIFSGLQKVDTIMWSYTCFILCVFIVSTSTSVNCLLDANQVYKLLSNRIHVENDLMRKDLIKLEEKIDLKDASLNKKIDSISSRISLLERDPGKIATEVLQQDTADNGQSQNRAINFDSIHSRLTIFRQALNSEKQFVRKLESVFVNKTGSLTENLRVMTNKIEKNEIEMNRLNESSSQAFVEGKQNLQLLESLFVHQFGALSEKQNITMDMIERIGKEMIHFNETMIIDHNMFNQQFERINQTQNVVESQIKTMSQEQRSMDSTIQNNQRSLNQVVNKQSSLDTIIQSNQRSLNQVVYKQSSLDSAIQSNDRSLDRIWNRMEERKVAFLADLSTTREFSVGSKIIFNQILFQEGSGYNRHTGVFTCPVTGVYMFSVVLTNENSAHTDLFALLKYNSVNQLNILSEKDDNHQNDQSSNFAIIKVYRGEKVWVEIYKRSTVVQRYRSNFSGALLYT